MTAENFANFATTTLVTASINAVVLTFAVTAGQGALFPTKNFTITMDTEVMFIASRSTDTFTVASGGRGYDSSTAATHTSGATIQLSITNYTLRHLWSNVADTYRPEVPPVQDLPATSPSTYDNEFESAGSWTLSPSPGGGTTFNAGTTVLSHLVLNRGTNDSANYTAYVPFAFSGAFTVTCKFSHATSLVHSGSADTCQFHLFATDQSNPASSPDTGNRVRYDDIVLVASPYHFSRAAIDTSGTYSPLSTSNDIGSLATPMFARLTHDGSGNWAVYVGDGYTYWLIGTKSSFLTSPVSIGVNAHLSNPSGNWLQQIVLVDYVRVVTGSVLPPYAN